MTGDVRLDQWKEQTSTIGGPNSTRSAAAYVKADAAAAAAAAAETFAEEAEAAAKAAEAAWTRARLAAEAAKAAAAEARHEAWICWAQPPTPTTTQCPTP